MEVQLMVCKAFLIFCKRKALLLYRCIALAAASRQIAALGVDVKSISASFSLDPAQINEVFATPCDSDHIQT